MAGTHEEAFLQDIVANPDDDAPRLIYADWLEEHGEAERAAHALGAVMPMARVLDIPGRDHMLAVGDKVFKAGVLAFLKERP